MGPAVRGVRYGEGASDTNQEPPLRGLQSNDARSRSRMATLDLLSPLSAVRSATLATDGASRSGLPRLRHDVLVETLRCPLLLKPMPSERLSAAPCTAERDP